MADGILKGWTMLIKKSFAIFLFVSASLLAAQSIKPMTEGEFSYYESMLRSGQADNYRKPTLQKDVWEKLLTDIKAQIIEAKVPKTIDGWMVKGEVQIPSRNKIRLLAFRLRTLIANPELEEITGQKLQWFKNIGNSFIVFEHYQNKMIAAVEQRNKKEYGNLYYSYMLNVNKLKKLLDNSDSWKLTRKELSLIQTKNSKSRKMKLDVLAKRYDYTRKLLKENPDALKDKSKNNPQQKNKRKGAKR